jgi:hypothetical protein
MGLDMELFLDRYGMSFALAGKQSPTTNKIWQRPMAKLNISMECLTGITSVFFHVKVAVPGVGNSQRLDCSPN